MTLKNILIGAFLFALAVQYVQSQRCICRQAVLPQDYFIVETRETESCVTEGGDSVVTKEIRQGQVQYGNQ